MIKEKINTLPNFEHFHFDQLFFYPEHKNKIETVNLVELFLGKGNLLVILHVHTWVNLSIAMKQNWQQNLHVSISTIPNRHFEKGVPTAFRNWRARGKCFIFLLPKSITAQLQYSCWNAWKRNLVWRRQPLPRFLLTVPRPRFKIIP